MLNQPIALALLGMCLLPSCASLPAPVQMMFQPVEQVRHSGSDVASSYYRLGRYHQDHGDLALALTAYTYAIARNPSGPEARIAAAVIHAQQGRLPQARAMLLAVCAEYPDLVQPRNNLGYVYYLQGEYGAAAAAFRQVLAMEPANQRALNNLALAEGANVRHLAARPAAVPAQAAAAVTPAPPPVEAQVEPGAPAGGMQLVRLASNMYELKMASPKSPPPAPRAVAAAETAAADAGNRQASRVEIANGNGVAGMAKRFREALAKRGVAVTRLTNARPFGRAQTSIEFRPGFEQQARGLQTVLGGKAVLQQADKLQARTDLRLVLGKDADLAFQQAPAMPDGAVLTLAVTPPSTNNSSQYQERK